MVLLISYPQPSSGALELSQTVVKNFSAFTFDYSKSLELDRWQGSFRHQQRLGLSIFNFKENLDVTRHRAPRLKDQWKTDQKARFDLQLPYRENLSWLMRGEWSRFYDQPLRSSSSVVAGGKIQSWYWGLGGTGRGAEMIDWNASLGPVYDEHYNQRQTGLKLDAGFEAALGGDLRGQLWFNQRSRDRDYSGTVHYEGTTALSEQASNQVKIDFLQTKQREMFYRIPQTGARQDNQLKIRNQLKVDSGVNWSLVWASEFNRQSSAHQRTSESYRDREWSWQNQIETGWRSAATELKLEGGLNFQEQKYAGSVILGRRYKLGLIAHWHPVPRDTLAMVLQAARSRFDTPAESDKNDRDELRYNFGLHCFHKITPEFSVIGKLEGSLNHLVYIFRSRSGENRWRRFFQFSMETPWKNEIVNNRAYFTVSANFTDYDFEPHRRTLSRVYRAFTVNDSLSLQIAPPFHLEVAFAGLRDDHGRLLWSEWIEEVSEEGYSWTAALIPTWQVDRFAVGCGWSEHQRVTRLRTPSGGREPGEEVYSQGPLLRLKGSPTPNLSIFCYMLWLKVSDRLRGGYYMPDWRVQVNWDIN